MKKVILFLVLFLVPFFVLAEESHESTLIPSASSGVLMEASTGEIVFSKDMYMEVPVASMTKMVAQILILEAIRDQTISWDDIVTVSQNAADMGGSQIYLSAGEKISIRDLMKGISMASANDATVMMAEVLGGSEKEFVNMMNRKVKELGLEHTHFVNSTGLDEEGHYSCSYDMAVIARELITKYPEILEFSSVYEDYLREDTENKFWLVNTNKLVRFYEGADGLKTGHTDAAKYCLAATAKKNNLVVGIYVKAIDDFSAAEKAGIKIGDVIIEADGKKITTMDELTEIKNSHQIGDEMKIKVNRDGEERELTVKLEEQP